jgi:hypothetical protein
MGAALGAGVWRDPAPGAGTSASASPAREPAPATGRLYLLLLYTTPRPGAPPAPPERVRTIVGEYRAWARALEGEGRLVQAEKLADDAGRSLPAGGAPAGAGGEVLGGFFLIRAADYEEAAALARTHPHLRYGGRVEIREIEPTAAAR